MEIEGVECNEDVAHGFAGKHIECHPQGANSEQPQGHGNHITDHRKPREKGEETAKARDLCAKALDLYGFNPQVAFDSRHFAQVTKTVRRHAAEPVAEGRRDNTQHGMVPGEQQRHQQSLG